MATVVFAIISAYLLFMGIKEYLSRKHFLERGIRVDGRVVDSYLHETRREDSDGDVHVTREMVETIEFTTADGRPILGKPRHSDVGESNRVGMTVTVLYDPNQPEFFVAPMDGHNVSVIWPVIQIGLGALTAVIAFILWFA